jgi:hypothetical protein
MEFTDLQKELEEVRKLLESMGTCYGIPISDTKPEVKLEMKKQNISQIKSQGQYLGASIRIYQRDIDREKKILEQDIDIEKEMKIRKLESDIRMEVLLTKLELTRKGLI